MKSDSNKRIIVKVGKTSDINFGNTLVHRAISTKDLEYMLGNKGDYSLIILENIEHDEVESLSTVLMDNTNISVVAYCRDAITQQLANKLNIHICRNKKELDTFMLGSIGLGLRPKIEWIVGNELPGNSESNFSELIGFEEKSKIDDTSKITAGATVVEDTSNGTEDATRDMEDDSKVLISDNIYIENRIKELEEKVITLQEIRDKLKIDCRELKEKYDSSIIKIGGLSKEIDELKIIIESKELDIESLEKEKKELAASIEMDKGIKEVREGRIIELENTIDKIKADDIVVENKVRELENNIEELEEEKKKLKDELDEKNKAYDALKEELEEKISNIAELEKGAQEAKIDHAYTIGVLNSNINTLQGSLEGIKLEKEELGAEVEKLNNSISSRDRKIQQLEDKVDEFDSLYTKREIEYNTKINDILSNNGKVGDIQEKYDNTIKELEKRNSELGEMNKRLLKRISGERLRVDIDYRGRARIITVFGSGSYGVTTTAVSIAKKLADGKVLFIDMDVVSPKADRLLGLTPIINELEDIDNPLYRTGISALTDKGSEYILKHKDKILRKSIGTKTGCVDYMSGTYNDKLKIEKLAREMARFVQLIGDDYDYIIVDCGTIGTSNQIGDIQYMMNSISMSSVIVTLKDISDIRNTAIRVRGNNLHSSKNIWLLNFAEDTIIDKLVKKSIGEASVGIMPKDMSIYGSKITFDRVPILRDRLSVLMDLVTKES